MLIVRKMRAVTMPTRAGALILIVCAGCGLGPRALHQTRLPYNEAVKVTSEEQLLLNIVRLRYSDNPSSLAVSSIAAQFEVVKQLQLVPFFTSGGDAMPRGFTSLLPGAQLNGSDRPTLSYTPQDEAEFTRRLFNPLSLDGVTYLAKTTWPLSTVFRLYLENLNWVPNGQTASGPTPETPPEYAEFLRGIEAMQRLQDRNRLAILLEETEEKVGDAIPEARVSGRDLVEAAKSGHEFKKDGANWGLVKKKEVPFLHLHPDEREGEDWREVCRVFRLEPGQKKYELEVTKLTPWPKEYPEKGVRVIDLETRSLLQVLFFVSHGVEVPPEHLASGVARATLGPGGEVFDYGPMMKGLFKVRWSAGKKRPCDAAVAVPYQGGWFYLAEGDHDSRATFAFLLYLSRMELGSKQGGPVLTLPVGGR